jgi:hypothetical protein
VARVAVTDDGGASVPLAGSLNLMAEGGRGLAMVAACTSRWGFAEAYPGRIVWAEASWPIPVPSPDDPGSPRSPVRAVRPARPSGWPPGPAALAPPPESRCRVPVPQPRHLSPLPSAAACLKARPVAFGNRR